MKNINLGLVVLFSSSLFTGLLEVKQESLSCRLVSTTTESIHTETPIEGLFLAAARSAGVCIFTDGRIADKQFVFSETRKEDFSEGTYTARSVLLLVLL